MGNSEETLDTALYPSNAYSKREEKSKEIETKKPKVDKVVTGEVKRKKRSLGDKFKETFLVSDSKSVGEFVFIDVIVPTIKELLADIINKGSNMLIFGDTRTTNRYRPGSSSRGAPQINYGSYSNQKIEPDRRKRNIDPRIRSTHQFDNLVFGSAWEAEDVRDKLIELIEAYGQATVADFYDAAGITSEYTDNKYGWEELGGAKIRRTAEGYVILLPKAGYLGE